MVMNPFLTAVFCVINLHLIVFAKSKDYPDEQCFFVPIENDYYALYIESENFDESIPKHFFGVCDTNTLSNWKPPPLKRSTTSSNEKIIKQTCNKHEISTKPSCDCSCSLRSRQLQPIPDFPTCFLGERRSKCNLKSRSARTSPEINNCTRCMTKHPKPEMAAGAASWRRGKRGEITSSSILDLFGTMKREDLLERRRAKFRGGSIKREYRRFAPIDSKNGGMRARKLPNNDLKLERSSNVELTRILKTMSRVGKKSLKRGLPEKDKDKTEEVADDDDDDDDDDTGGEDIAIEEETEKEAQTTETAEKDELRQEQLSESKKHNLTQDVNDENPLKNSTTNDEDDENSNASQVLNTTISIICMFVLLYLPKLINAMDTYQHLLQPITDKFAP